MGLFGWFPFIRKKGYNPNPLHNSVLPSLTTGTRHFDILANCFLVVRTAYTNLPQEAAHRMLEKEIEHFGTKDNLRLYIDGPQAIEKQNTAEVREANCERALKRVAVSLNTFESRLNENKRIRKRHHSDIKAGLASSFYWSHTSRMLFAEYMTTRGWTVQICTTEADLSIAQSIQANDVVISKDSDMLAYGSVVTLWRPVSNNVILEYKVPELLRTLSFTRAQLTALAVVSRNDYHQNIYSLGPVSNFGIIKKIGQSEDPRVIVAAYLSHSQVIARNTQYSTFENSIRVFVDYQQIPASSPNLDPLSQTVFQEQRQRYEDLCIRSSSRAQQTVDKQPRDTFVRLDARPQRSFNRYRTVESPAFVSNATAAAAAAPTLATLPSVPDPEGHPVLARTRIPKNRGRYSFKTRARKISHTAPPMSKQFKLKFYTRPPDTVNNSTPAKKTTSKANKPLQPNTKPIADKDKRGLLRSLSWHHPTAWLDIGTLETNVGRVSGDEATLRIQETPLSLNIMQQEVVDCIQEAVRLAANVKRNAQRLIGGYLETLAVRMHAAEETKRTELQKVSPPMTMTNADRRKARRDAVTDDEREILTHLCVRLNPNNTDQEQRDVEQKKEDNTDLDEKGNIEQQFLRSFLTYLYSGNYPGKAGVGVVVNKLIDWLTDHGFHRPIRARRDLNETMPFTPSMLVRSVSVQLAVEFQRIYGQGTQDIHKQAAAMVEKRTLPPETDIGLQDDISAIENFLQLNRITGNRRQIVPLTTSELPFVSFTETELATFFWKREPLKRRLKDLAAEDGSFTNTFSDIADWIAGKGPGNIIKQFIADVAPQVATSRQRRKEGYRGAVKLLTLEQIKSHLRAVQDEWVDPVNYNTKGYILRGSIRTDGFLLQLPAYKLRELQSVRYRRLEHAKLPPRLTSTIGGTDYYLQEIRHVITCKEDVEKLWPGVPVDRIKTLTLDGGQVCVIGAFVDLAEDVLSHANGKENANESSMEGVTTTTTTTTTTTVTTTKTTDNQLTINATTSKSSKVPVPLPHTQGSPTVSSRTTFLNLAVKQKSVYQPTFKFQRWLEDAKKEQVCVDGQQLSILEIESQLPPLKGQNSSVISYVQELERVEEYLQEFYAGSGYRFKRHKWDMKRARENEYQLIADRLLGIVGGSVGRRYDPSNPVLIGVGLGNFSVRSGLSALHSTFLDFFIQKARSLGYIIIGLNEFYTSKKCPHCGNFVAQVTLRRFFCHTCRTYHHRDVLAAENTANIIQGHLVQQERPLYLQPVTSDGTYPWQKAQTPAVSASSLSGTSTSDSSSSAISSQGRSKRASALLSSGRSRKKAA